MYTHHTLVVSSTLNALEPGMLQMFSQLPTVLIWEGLLILGRVHTSFFRVYVNSTWKRKMYSFCMFLLLDLVLFNLPLRHFMKQWWHEASDCHPLQAGVQRNSLTCDTPVVNMHKIWIYPDDFGTTVYCCFCDFLRTIVWTTDCRVVLPDAERTCHSMVHRTFSHSELGRNYNSIEAGKERDKKFQRLVGFSELLFSQIYDNFI